MASPRKTPRTATVTFDRRTFDARPDRLDLRDLPYRPPLRSLPPQWPADPDIARFIGGYVAAKLILDQGTEGACTGFGLACVTNYLLWMRALDTGAKKSFERVSPRMFYELAKRYDEWPGEDYDGSSCRGALKGWHKHGVCADTLWPYPLDAKGKPLFVPPKDGWAESAVSRPLGVYYRVDRKSVVDLQAAIREIGAVYVSAQVHGGWDTLLRDKPSRAPTRAADLPIIPPKPKKSALGGHAFALVGYDDRGFLVQNSWGPVWGRCGFAVLPYDDWVQHATDAWACALGVPIQASRERLDATAYPVAGGRSLSTLARAARNPQNPNDDPWPIDKDFAHAGYQPWSTATAYGHTLVSGNEGRLVVSDLTFGTGGDDESVERYAREIVLNRPLASLAAQPGKVVKLALYAHGGLNKESESIDRIRVLAPYFAENGIYPLFLTWKTGPLETLVSMLRDRLGLDSDVEAARLGGFLDSVRNAADRLVEAKARLFLRGVWSEMRENAQRATRERHALDLAAKCLLELRDALQKKGKTLEIHLVGHSAGSIVLGHLLERWSRDDLLPAKPRVASATLYAAACSVEFALRTYGGADQAGILPLTDLSMYYLSDENEKADALPTPRVSVYGKSLLYLVSRALDDIRKIPLLGMERAHQPGFARDEDQWAREHHAHLVAWQKRWQPAPDSCLTERQVRVDKTGARKQAVHGSFDNDIAVLTTTLQRIAGKPLVAPMEWLDY